MNKIHQGKIIENIALTEGVYLLSLEIPVEIDVKPGQFFLLRTNDRHDPLLGRPLSIFDMQGDRLSFLYRVRGKGTRILSKLHKDEKIHLTGPFGRWYPFPKDDYVVIAGGIGIASVFYLMKKFPQRAYLFYGARDKREVFFYNDLKKITKYIHISTECGAFDFKGFVTEAFRECGKNLNLPIYVCGPMVMIREIKNLLIDREEITCYVAAEERMACGLGACLGCVIETTDGPKRVCTEGPVFNLNELKL